jgi:hypothetical protein
METPFLMPVPPRRLQRCLQVEVLGNQMASGELYEWHCSGWKLISDCFPFRPDDIIIAVMGVTGVGKSSFISLLAKDPSSLVVGHTLEAC